MSSWDGPIPTAICSRSRTRSTPSARTTATWSMPAIRPGSIVPNADGVGVSATTGSMVSVVSAASQPSAAATAWADSVSPT